MLRAGPRQKAPAPRLAGGVLTPGGTAVLVYCNEETPLTVESHAFPEDMVNAFRYPLPSSHKQRARKLRERDHGSPHLDALILGTRATKRTRQHTHEACQQCRHWEDGWVNDARRADVHHPDSSRNRPAPSSTIYLRWAEARVKIARMTLTIKLDRNWSSFQLANSAPPLSVTDSAIAPSARMSVRVRAARDW